MNIITAFSAKPVVDEAIRDIKNQFGAFVPKAVVFFVSAAYSPDQSAKKMQEAFPGAQTFGCTTAGEIVSGKVLKQSIVAMAFNAAAMRDTALAVVENIDKENRVPEAFASFEKYYKTPMKVMDFKEYVGIILVDGLRGAEEKLMEKIGNLTNVFFIGGSAGDDLKFTQTHVFANGKTYTNAAVLALLKPAMEFDFIKTQSFCVLDKNLVATRTDEAKRTVIEFNHKPALQAYADALGVPVEKAPSCFMHNPVGLMMNAEPYVRSPQQAKDGSMVFYCSVLQGMELSVLESTDIVKDTIAAITQKRKELGSISAIINFNCILRTLELEQKGLTDAYGKVFSDIPTVGFSTYGEEFVGHINQTATMIVFK